MLRHAKRVIGCILFGMFLWVIGCGYKFYDGRLPEEISRIHIAVFTNRSSETGLENSITDNLAYEITRGGSVMLVDRENADAVISGDISARSEVVSQRGNIAVQKRIVLTANVVLRNKAGDTLRNIQTISADMDYMAADSVSQEETVKQDALTAASKRLSEDIFKQLTSDF